MLDLKILIKNLKQRLFGSRVFLQSAALKKPIVVKDSFTTFLKQSLAVGAAIIIITSFTTHNPETGYTAEFIGDNTDLLMDQEIAPAMPSLIMNEEGFILKPSSATADTSRIGFTDSVNHTVVSGENVHSIAKLYGLSARTILWDNNISEDTSLKVGQTLIIPAVDGIGYIASKSETLSSIAKSFGVDEKLVREHNNLTGDTIVKGQRIFIPGGKKKEEPKQYLVRDGTRTGRRTYNDSTFNSKVFIASNDKPSSGKKLIFPTIGEITQRFHDGHYAFDIGNSGSPDVWAAADGTVVSAKGGCPNRDVEVNRGCNGGYGNNVIIDHGDGLQTLYAHLQTIYVNEGQKIIHGQALGKMGSSGRVYGPTGIHLHFEVRDNGAKRNPANYF